MTVNPCQAQPGTMPAEDMPDDVFDAHMATLAADWQAHLATCGQHCRCGASAQYCTAPASAGDLLCKRCRSCWDPQLPGADEERRLLCAIFTHRGPYRPGEFHAMTETKM